MRHIDTVVIGAGQAGLAISRCLTDAGVDHVVLERGRIAERWRSERWDSLRLLTPNWMTRLPGWSLRRPRPRRLHDRRRGRRLPRPLRRARSTPRSSEDTAVRARRAARRRLRRRHRPGHLARRPTSSSPPAGATDPRPGRRRRLSADRSTRSRRRAYRNPGELPDGGVLVVGASATGVQLADELRPRRPRGRARRRQPQPAAAPLPRHGHLLVARADRRARPDHRRDPRPERRPPRAVAAARRPPRHGRPRPGRRCSDVGVRAHRPAHRRRRAPRSLRRRPRRDRRRAPTRGSTPTARRDRRLHRRHRPRPPRCSTANRQSVPSAPTSQLDASTSAAGITTVVWATGFRRRYPWLRMPVLDATARSANAAASPRCPACTSSASASSTAATPTSSTASATTPSSSPTTSTARDRRPAGHHAEPARARPHDNRCTDRPTTSSSSAPARRSRHRDAAGPARACVSSWSTAAATAPTPSRPTP